ncbi:MAG: GTP-binding protein [Phycisphaerae bacterium]
MPEPTYCVLTDVGPAAIAVIRVVGLDAATLGRLVRFRARSASLIPGLARRAELLDAGGEPIDDMLVSCHGVHPLDIRIHLHGGPWLVRTCCAELRRAGVRQAESHAAELWRGLSPIAAEAYTLLPRMRTLAGATWLIAQISRLGAALREIELASRPEQHAAIARLLQTQSRVDWFLTPLRIAIVGPPNAGKSTLANALADRAVSLVSPTPGTTRDWVEFAGEVDGMPVTWVDTAGLHASRDELESAGIALTRRMIATCDLTLVVLDATASAVEARRTFIASNAALRPARVALSKADLAANLDAARAELPASWRELAFAISAATNVGIQELISDIIARAGRLRGVLPEPTIFTPRLANLLEHAADQIGCNQLSFRSLYEPAATASREVDESVR